MTRSNIVEDNVLTSNPFRWHASLLYLPGYVEQCNAARFLK